MGTFKNKIGHIAQGCDCTKVWSRWTPGRPRFGAKLDQTWRKIANDSQCTWRSSFWLLWMYQTPAAVATLTPTNVQCALLSPIQQLMQISSSTYCAPTGAWALLTESDVRRFSSHNCQTSETFLTSKRYDIYPADDIQTAEMSSGGRDLKRRRSNKMFYSHCWDYQCRVSMTGAMLHIHVHYIPRWLVPTWLLFTIGTSLCCRKLTLMSCPPRNLINSTLVYTLSPHIRVPSLLSGHQCQNLKFKERRIRKAEQKKVSALVVHLCWARELLWIWCYKLARTTVGKLFIPLYRHLYLYLTKFHVPWEFSCPWISDHGVTDTKSALSLCCLTAWSKC